MFERACVRAYGVFLCLPDCEYVWMLLCMHAHRAIVQHVEPHCSIHSFQIFLRLKICTYSIVL